jgi:hypothetical protein
MRAFTSMQESERHCGAEIQQRRQACRERAPGAARRVVTLEIIEQRRGGASAPLCFELGEPLAVARERRIGSQRRFVEQRLHGLGQRRVRQRVERLRALAPIADDARLAQPPEVRRDARLRDAGDLHEVAHA